MNIELNKNESLKTPMMQQYISIKNNYQDCLLLYRLGDFYELFFEDALIAAKILDITLTRRGKSESQNISMCGIPFHALELYLPKLIKSNHKIAICEQLESPEDAKKRGSKEVVKREVVRVITPGTIIEENLLEAKSSSYLCSLTKVENDYSISWLDISTGSFYYCKTSINNIASDLARIDPKEILISDNLFADDDIKNVINEYSIKVTTHVASFFDYRRSENRLKIYYKIYNLDSFGPIDKSSIAACGSIIEYIYLTQKDNLPYISIPKKLVNNNFMILDPSTKKSLELINSFNCEKNNSLLSVIDRTITNAGGRLLADHLSSPLIDITAINNRLNKIEFFIKNPDLKNKIAEVLKNIGDIERATIRLTMNRGGPRDLNLIKVGLYNAFKIVELIEYSGIELPKEIIELTNNLAGHNDIIKEIDNAIKDEVPILARDGKFIRNNYHHRLKELLDIQNNSKITLEKLREKYRNHTKISNLKIDKNNVIGYYIEISPSHSKKITDDMFIHRQTLITGIRYTTLELKELESNIINSKELILRLELQLFQEIVAEIDKIKEKIFLASYNIAAIDLAIGFANLAIEMNYTRPVIDNSRDFMVKEGRHPVVEEFISKNNIDFIANDCTLNDQNLMLLTGPNMAGKSTYLRQNAIIAIMAQIGSFVPAKSVHIGVIDRIFSRVGAYDDLAHGRSTFMVEMAEAATILNQATNRSFLILDEVGRGTSTFDGVSIAWSITEHIHNNIGARTIFATHYHELTDLSKTLSSLVCYSMKIQEWEDKIIFLHSIAKGAVDKSYGIHVAQIAGIPESVIIRARNILSSLENNDKNIISIEQIEYKKESIIEKELKNIDINSLTPIESFNILNRLKSML